jgi:RimJ/RimL family protein N-acetyltransferase
VDHGKHRTTARLNLRPIAATDRDHFVAIHIDPRTNIHVPTGTPSIEWAEAFLDSLLAAWTADLSYWAVECDGVVVGFGGVEPRMVLDRPCWNLYYRFAPEVWGKGFATEVASEAVKAAEAAQPDRPTVVRTRPGNIPAISVAERAGLTRRPELDHEGLAVLTTRWRVPIDVHGTR